MISAAPFVSEPVCVCVRVCACVRATRSAALSAPLSARIWERKGGKKQNLKCTACLHGLNSSVVEERFSVFGLKCLLLALPCQPASGPTNQLIVTLALALHCPPCSGRRISFLERRRTPPPASCLGFRFQVSFLFFLFCFVFAVKGPYCAKICFSFVSWQ